jgi:ketosteroid isomerase-like protein
MSTLTRFYTAFAQRDWAAMGVCYADDARFSDPVFPDLEAASVRAMWKMLLTSGTDLRVTFRVVEEAAERGVCELEAFYTFSKSGKKVHNKIRSEFKLRDGLIYRQRDHFNFWRWSTQALGVTGMLLGWSPMLKNKVRGAAAASLRRAMT